MQELKKRRSTFILPNPNLPSDITSIIQLFSLRSEDLQHVNPDLVFALLEAIKDLLLIPFYKTFIISGKRATWQSEVGGSIAFCIIAGHTSIHLKSHMTLDMLLYLSVNFIHTVLVSTLQGYCSEREATFM